jgi:hypothetical protein
VWRTPASLPWRRQLAGARATDVVTTAVATVTRFSHAVN